MKRSIIPVAAVLGFAMLLTGVPGWGQSSDLAVTKAREFIKLLEKGDYNGAYGKVDSNLGFKVDAAKLGAVWQRLVSKAGPVVEYKNAKTDVKSGYTIVTQLVKFQKGHVDVLVALDQTMRVADFSFKNHEAKAPAAGESGAGSAGGSAPDASDPAPETPA